MQQNGQNAAPPGVSPDYHVLLHAISGCAGLAVQQILKQSPSVINVKGWHGQTPLHKACLTGDNAIVTMLLDAGADPNATNDFEETPVHYACKRGVPTLVDNLVRRGGDLDKKDKVGKNAIHNCALTGSVYMLQYFEEKGYGFKQLDDNLQSPLHHVCSFGHLEAFKFLMRKGRSDPSVRDRDGNTPLHICAREGYGHGSWLLINYLGPGAVKVTNNQGYTPRDLCAQNVSAKKIKHSPLLNMLTDASNLPPKGYLKGPLQLWYWNLLMPTLVYSIGLLFSQNVFINYQGLTLFVFLGYIIGYVRQNSHRMPGFSGWPNPIHAGLFSAGMLHTMLLYYVHMVEYIEYTSLIYFSMVCNVLQFYLYYRLLTIDPGVISSNLADKTGRPTSLLDLMAAKQSMDLFCVDCEIVKSRHTKHCKLCNKCYYRMDHHCLFLLQCVGCNNHTRFVWFLIFTGFVMFMFLVQAFMYINVKFVDLKSYTGVFIEMFWTDGWVFTMTILIIGSLVFVCILIKYQIAVVAKGHTQYFQTTVSTLTPVEKFLNTLYFLQGRAQFAVDYDVEWKSEEPDVTLEGRHNEPRPIQNV